jgi:beta-lactam-binding protein with PASTA domain
MNRSIHRWFLVFTPMLMTSLSMVANLSELEIPAFTETVRTFEEIELSSDDAQITLELRIYRWGESEAATQGFSLSILESPDFLRSSSISESRVEFGPEDWEMPVEVQIEADPEAEAGAGNLVLEILAEDADMTPGRRQWIFPLVWEGTQGGDDSESDGLGNYEFVVRTIAEDYDASTKDNLSHIKHLHDEDIPLYSVDPVFVCFTAPADDIKFQYFRVYGPDGKIFQEGSRSGGTNLGRDINTLDRVEDAPYEVMIPFARYRKDETAEDNRSLKLPGEYRIEVAEAVYQGGDGIYGTSVTAKPEEWVEIGKFELKEPKFEFQGMTTMVFSDEKPEYVEMYTPYCEVSPKTGGRTGSVKIDFEWYDRLDREMREGNTSFNYVFPDTVPFSKLETIGSLSVNLEEMSGEAWEATYGPFPGLYIKEEEGEFFTPINGRFTSDSHKLDTIPFASYEKFTQEGRTKGADFVFKYSNYAGVALGAQLYHSDKSFGWHLRTPNTRYGMAHVVFVNGDSAGNIATVAVIGIYASNDETVTQAELVDRGRTMERPPEREEESDDDAEENESDERNEATTQPDTGRSGETGGPGATGSAADGSIEGSPSGVSSTDGSIYPEGRSPSGVGELGGGNESDTFTEEAIDPNDPNVAALIEEWRSIAEPPENATEGANFRYNPWGIKVGQAMTGTATANQKPDGVGSMTSPEFLWSQRTTLDSVDHCTLGEYVMARLNGNSMEHCRGKYERISLVSVPAVLGQSMEAAISRLENLGLAVNLAAGEPATTDRQVGTIASQVPAAGTQVKTGSTVDLEIFIEPIQQVRIPDLVLQPFEQAEAKLHELGLQVALSVGDPAQKAEDQHKIQSQSPVAGEMVLAGDTVKLSIYTDFVTLQQMPNLVGMPFDKAEASLQRLGLSSNLEVGDAAPLVEKEATIQSQVPAAGASLPSGQAATLTIYTSFVAASGGVDTQSASQQDVSSTSSVASGTIKPSRVNSFIAPEKLLGSEFQGASRTIRKPASEWWNTVSQSRKAKMNYQTRNGYSKFSVEVFWLEPSDASNPTNDRIFDAITWWKIPKNPGYFPLVKIQDGPWYFHHSEGYLTVKLTSEDSFQGIPVYLPEDFAREIFENLKAYVKPRRTGYTPIPQIRIPRRFQELPISRFAPADLGTRKTGVLNWAKTSCSSRKNIRKNWNGFVRELYTTFEIPDRRANNNAEPTSIYGLPTGTQQREAPRQKPRLLLWCNWLEYGDPIGENIHEVFTGKDQVLEDTTYYDPNDQYKNTITYYYTSSELALTMKAIVDVPPGYSYGFASRKQALRQLFEDLKRQFEGHALKMSDMPRK